MRVLLSLALGFALTANANADEIIFTHEGSGNGTLDGTPFDTSDFVITAMGDTDDRMAFESGFYIDHMTATIDIVGLGTFDFITDTLSFVNNNNEVVGFSGPVSDLFDGPFDAAFATWDMTTSIGPISGIAVLFPPQYLTSGGVLSFEGSTTQGTFTATVIPEPSSTALLGVCLIAGWMRRRR